MRYVVPHLCGVMVAVSLLGGAAPPNIFAQVKPEPPEAKTARGAATQPIDAPAALARPLPEIKLEQIPLADVVDALRDLASVSFVVDYHALQRAGVDRSTPITLAGKNLSTEEILDRVLKPFADKGVQHRAGKEAVYISTKSDLEALDRFRQRNAAAMEVGPLNPRLVAQSADDLPHAEIRLNNIPLLPALDELARRSALKIEADKEGLARVGMDAQEPVALVLRNPLLGDALAAALWVTGRIDDLDLRVEGTTITVIPRAENVAK